MSKELKNQDNKIALFEWKEVRKITHNNEWWFSVVDIIDILNVSWREARKYWSDLKKKLIDEWYSEVSENIGQLKLIAFDWKIWSFNAARAWTYFNKRQTWFKKPLWICR